MRHAGLRRWLILAALLVGTTSAHAQLPPGAANFANDPHAPPAPEFCPMPMPPITRTPFDGLENAPANGFTEPCHDDVGPPCIVYLGGGALALQRERLGNGQIAATGDAADITAATFNTAPSRYHWGVTALVGVQQGANALEVSGFYLGEKTDRGVVSAPGQLNVAFFNSAAPAGFNPNVWRQADQVAVDLRTELGSAELNYRYIFGPPFELICGVRYLDQTESLAIITDNAPNNAFGTAQRVAYETEARNRIVGGQLGFEVNEFLLPGRFALGLSNKNVVGMNFMEASNRLVGNSAVVGLGQADRSQVSGAVEVNAFATIWFNPSIRLRGGYQALWLFNVAQAHDQVNFNSTQSLTEVNRSDSLFYHGPRVELHIAF